MKIVDIQPTPNPNAMKVMLDAPASVGTKSYFNAEAGKDDPLAVKLFAVQGVIGVMLLGKMVTISKNRAAEWPTILTGVRMVFEAEKTP